MDWANDWVYQSISQISGSWLGYQNVVSSIMRYKKIPALLAGKGGLTGNATRTSNQKGRFKCKI